MFFLYLSQFQLQLLQLFLCVLWNLYEGSNYQHY